LNVKDTLLNGVFHNQSPHSRGAGLPESPHAVTGLILDGWSPP